MEYVLRSGDINSKLVSQNRAQEGSRIHSKIQKQRIKQAKLQDEVYEKEVFLSHSFEYKGFEYKIEGRADGIWHKKTGDMIEEIKSTLKPAALIEKNEESWHFAQAKCYAYLYCLKNSLETISIQITYVNVETLDSVCFNLTVTFTEAESFFYDVINKYTVFAQCDIDRISERNETVKALNFPYESYRKNQRDFAVAVYKTICAGKKLFAQAPTGTGKTISTIFPSLKALAEERGDKIFYATAKTTTRQTAEEAFFLMSKKGLKVRTVTLTAKDKICFLEKRACNPTDCKFAEGHFDRVNSAIIDIITNETQILRSTIEGYAWKHKVCPYEFSLDVTLFCDVIICDYNYIYDPTASLKRFFSEDAAGNYIVLHDEAHNLVDRAREMFSAELKKSQCVSIKKLCAKKSLPLHKAVGKIISWFKDIETEDGVTTTKNAPDDLKMLIYGFVEAFDRVLSRKPEEIEALTDECTEFYFLLKDMLRAYEYFDERYVFYIECQKKEMTVKLLCLDPSFLLGEIQKNMLSTIFFSATLTPINYFKQVLGGSLEDFEIALPSPYSFENFCLLIDNSINTTYKERLNSYEIIADRLFSFISAKKGNYFVFFPSYIYMLEVYEAFSDKFPEIKTVKQTQDMTEEERDIYLNNFNVDNEETLLGFTVLGGAFSEGIDLAGEKLIGACIVGVGLPMITEERNVMRDYYKEQGLDGFNYAYVYPGINKVMQAAGRVIRSENDKGTVLLIDSRFLNSLYKGLFPHEWRHYKKITNSNLNNILDEFWSNTPVL